MMITIAANPKVVKARASSLFVGVGLEQAINGLIIVYP